MNLITGTAAGVLLSLAALPAARGADTVHKEEDIRKTLTFSAPAGAARRLVVDNITGSISVVGTDDRQVTLVAHETIRAESEERLETARQKVRLEITEEPDRILLYVNAPWRCPDGSIHNDGWEDYGYEVTFDFELRVPLRTDLVLRTVNDGGISVRNAEGSFRISNVNGGISLSGVSGSGEFSTVNGDVGVAFSHNPSSSSTFRTINGQVEVRFQNDFSADLRLKTLNGEVFTDFEVTGLPSETPTLTERMRKRVYRTGGSFRARVGHGGPDLTFDTLNGNIYIVKNEER